jgi:predicted nucleic acid-binding protein
MSVKTFIDTNFLLYAHDSQAGEKQIVAQSILEDLWLERSGALSMQVLQEFYVNAVRKLAAPLPRPAARAIVHRYRRWCVATGPEEIDFALEIEDRAGISFWDALIVAAAHKAGAERILSEDLDSGQRIAGILIENPFAV